MKKQNMFLTVVFLAFFILGLLTESMEVVAIVFATIIMAVFIVGIKNEIVKLRKELASKKNLHE
jgi:ABC-type proline/glycine betaine transport system permease subunit